MKKAPDPFAKLKNHFRDGIIHRLMQRRRDQKVIGGWDEAGRPQPPPPAFKQQLIRDMARRFGTRVLVETGTFSGSTIAASFETFDTIYSIELQDELYECARRRFSRHPKVRLRHGDSAHELPRILDELAEPALFWLDAHYSGDGTARSDVDTPVANELLAIFQHIVSGHLILIDDARCFDGTNDYPTIEATRILATQLWPSHVFAVDNDIIRITPS